jgi:hypothetical protein
MKRNNTKMNNTSTDVRITTGSLMFGGSDDPRIGGESMWLDDHNEVTVILGRPSNDCTEIAIDYAHYYPEICDAVGGGSLELTREQARWLAANLLRAAEACGDGSEQTYPG